MVAVHHQQHTGDGLVEVMAAAAVVSHDQGSHLLRTAVVGDVLDVDVGDVVWNK